MAVAERTFTDPTAQILTSLLNLGGKKETSTASASADPAAIGALQEVLNAQMGGITPEGAAKLIQAIFSEGMRQVPGLATTYAQAAGARTKGNSPLQFAMQDMMARLTQEANKALSSNQQNAAQTAGKFADATRKETKTATSSPKASMMQLAPFLLANAGKLKGMIPSGLSKGVSDFFSGSSPDAGVVNFGSSNFAPAGQDNFSLAFDQGPSINGLTSEAPTTSDTGGGSFDTGGFALNDGFGLFGDASNGLDFASGAADLGISTDLVDPAVADEIFSGFSFAKGGHVNLAKMRAPGYASGGTVNVGGFSNKRDAGGKPIRGSTMNGGDAQFDLARALTQSITAPAMSRVPVSAGASRQRPFSTNADAIDFDGSTGASGEGVGTASGETGTPGENAAAVNGMAAAVAGLVGMAMGVPGLSAVASLGLTAMGQPSSSMSPVTQAMTALSNMASIGAPSMSAALSGIDQAAQETLGMTTPASPEDASTAIDAAIASLAQETGMANADAAATSAGAGEGGGIGGSGNSAGDAGAGDGGDGSSGDGSGSGGGTASAARGGSIQGPGTETSDSIMARLSDNEYVLNANAVDALGVDFLDMINHVMFPSDAAVQKPAQPRKRA